MNDSIELRKIDIRSLVAIVRPDKSIKEFVVCSYYDGTKEMGSRWCWGHYFNQIEDAVDYLTGE